MSGNKSCNLPANTEQHVRFLLQEYRGVNTNQLDFTLCSSETQVNVLTDFKDIADSILALVDSSHVDRVRINLIEHTNENHAI